MSKVVYAHTPNRADWNSTDVHDVVPADALALEPDVDVPLHLIETQTFGNGVVVLHSERRRLVAAGG